MTSHPSANNSNSDFTFREVFLLGFSVLGISVYQKFGSFQRFYLIYYKHIWISLYALIALLIVIVIWQIKKRTQALSKRVALVSEVARQPDSIYVGRTQDGVALHLSEDQRTGHVQILGSTGRGKTESVILSWLCRDLWNKRTAILIDGKGDPAIVEQVAAQSWGYLGDPCIITFDLGNPEKSVATNPLASGSAQQITERIFTAFTFDDSYYKSVQSDVTLSIIQLIHEFDVEVTFQRLYDLLTKEAELTKLLAMSQNVPLKTKLTAFLLQPIRTREEKLSGLLSQIAPFAIGEVALLVNGRQKGKHSTTVSDVILGNGLRPQSTLFAILIPTLKYQNIGHQLGKLLLQELGWAVGERASRSGNYPFVPVYLDEFSSFVYPNFANILNKARSSNVALHLSHQSLGDLSTVSSNFAQIVNTNTNVKCILGVNDPESADWIASHFGTVTIEKVTERAEKSFLKPRDKTGDVSVREVEAYKVHPNLLKSFTKGRGVLHLPTNRGSITEVIQFERVGGDA